MGFKSKVEFKWPEAQFTGGSHIHASVARSGTLALPFDEPRVVLKALRDAQLPAYMMRTIEKQTPGWEWLLSTDEFADLIMVDFYRLLHGNATQETQQRLRNPNTGNWFHRITLLEDDGLVGGVRVWCDGYTAEQIVVGFRFRIQGLDEEATKTRQKARAHAEALVEEVEEVKEYIAKEEKELQVEVETLNW